MVMSLFDENNMDSMSTSKQCPGPIVNSVLLSIFGVFIIMSNLLFAIQSVKLFTHAIILLASPG